MDFCDGLVSFFEVLEASLKGICDLEFVLDVVPRVLSVETYLHLPDGCGYLLGFLCKFMFLTGWAAC